MNVGEELKKYRIKPGSAVRLEDWDPNDKGRYKGGKEDARQDLVRLSDEQDTLQDLLFAEREHRLLVILQAMDTGGKDGTIRSVFNSVDLSVSVWPASRRSEIFNQRIYAEKC